MRKRVLMCMAVTMMASPLAWAAANPADYDGDGRISQEEFRNQAARTAFSADKNSNGALDEGEVKLTPEQRKVFDANGDGSVSVEEFQAGQLLGFTEADKNGDGYLDANEMKGGR